MGRWCLVGVGCVMGWLPPHVEGGDEGHLVHDLSLALPHVGRGRLATVSSGVGERGGYQCAVGAREVVGVDAEVLLGHGLHAVDAVAHLDGVEIDLHDALLAPKSLDEESEVGLQALAQPRAALPQKHVLGRLLRDGAAATQPLAVVEVLQGGLLDGFVVEAVVLHEALVLAGDHSHGHGARHTLQRNPLVVETDGTAIGDLFEATREHERREIDRHKAIGHHREQRGGEEQGQGQTDYLEYLFHHIRLQRYKEKSKWI